MNGSLVFGPVPSRRLGRSLGINNIPAKTCSYSCVYCQLGRTLERRIEPCHFYRPSAIREQVCRRLEMFARTGEAVDFLTLVPDGEPTLDCRLGETIELLRPFGVRIAVITNGSLLWRPRVRAALAKADWVSVKIDAVDPRCWRRIDRPDPGLALDTVLRGVHQFAAGYGGTLVTETMLVAGLNDAPEGLRAVADCIASLQPDRVYLAVPTRPPAEPWVAAPDEAALTTAHQLFAAVVPRVEYLIGSEGVDFTAPGDIAAELLSITAVHPMPEEAVTRLMAERPGGRQAVEALLNTGKIVVTEYRGKRFYVRKLP